MPNDTLDQETAPDLLLDLQDRYDAPADELSELVEKAAAERRNFSDDETAKRAELEETIETLDSNIAAVTADRARKATAAARRVDLGIGDSEPNDRGLNVSVNSEPRTYERGNGHSYFLDLAFSARPGVAGHAQATERLKRHALEIATDTVAMGRKPEAHRSVAEKYQIRQVLEVINTRTLDGGIQNRDLATAAGNGGEFVPPMYLTEQYVPYARPGRVFADRCYKQPLPGGTMSINIPKVVTGATVATQGFNNTNVSDTDITTAFVTFPVVTKAGSQVISLQLLERSPIPFDDVIFKDLALALAQSVDLGCLVGPGSGVAGTDVTGAFETSGINTITWTAASPKAYNLLGQIASAKSQIATQRFLPATDLFMTPTRWEWIEQSLDSNNRPLVVPVQNGPFNVLTVAPDEAVAEGYCGRWAGMQVWQDFNIPRDVLSDALNPSSGTQDLVFVTRSDDLFLYEAPVVARALPQTYGAQLSVLVQLYEYMAFTAARYPVSVSVITGTGLVPPSFNS